jgi:hypothetical protein
MEGSYAATADRAREEIVAMIPKGATVFRCGSMTAAGMGLWDAIAQLPGVELIDPYHPGISKEEGLERRRRGMTADVMIASANAITLDGKLVNLDGMGRYGEQGSIYGVRAQEGHPGGRDEQGRFGFRLSHREGQTLRCTGQCHSPGSPYPLRGDRLVRGLQITPEDL